MMFPPDGSAKPRARLIGRWFVRLGLAAVFLYAGIVKFREPSLNFADSISSFRLLPVWAVSPLALALPPFEILVGGALLMNRPRRLGAFCALVLGAIFLVALAAAMARGITVDCSCFGSGHRLLPLTPRGQMWLDLGRDFLMLAAATQLYRQDAAHVRQARAIP